MKGILIYKGKYGATQQYATWIGADTKLSVKSSYEYGQDELADNDFLVIGTSVYMGMLGIKEWLKINIGLLTGKKIFLFVVCGTPSDEKEKQEEYIRSSVPDQIREQCSIYFLPGRLNYKKISWADKFMLRIGSIFAGNEKEKTRMLNGFDGVKKENINPIVKGIKEFAGNQMPAPVLE
jgi:menaquinone-dependent protoporphyrinogen IX oxidase